MHDAWELMVRYQRATLLAMDATLRDRFGRSLDDYDVLHQLHQATEPLRMGELAERLLVANSSCNRIVQRLVEAGLVERRVDPDDRRVVTVVSTAEGRRLHRRMAVAHARDIDRLFADHLTRSELDTLAALMARLLGD